MTIAAKSVTNETVFIIESVAKPPRSGPRLVAIENDCAKIAGWIVFHCVVIAATPVILVVPVIAAVHVLSVCDPSQGG